MKITATISLLILCIWTADAQKIIPLYTGKAPGSENWTHTEKVDTIKNDNLIFVSNVSQPTLTVFKPNAAKANGTAVIVCPGGAFRILAIQNEGIEVAQWLNQQGITAFILKYRLVPDQPGAGKQLTADLQSGNFKRIDSINAPFVPLAVNDGLAAVTYVRQHATEYGINPSRIGMIGFSAGGTLIASVAQTYSAQSRPNFVAPIYAYTGAILGNTVPKDAPPLFLALAGDDFIANGNPDLYKRWRDAGHSAELHIYSKGGHGFGIRKQRLPSDQWIEQFRAWLQMQGFIDAANGLKN